MKSCNTSPRNKYGAEALSMGAASGHISTVRLLLDAGAKVSGGGARWACVLRHREPFQPLRVAPRHLTTRR